MLRRKRSRSKQALMADPRQKQRLFTIFTSFKSFAIQNDAIASPTSTLDPKPFTLTKNLSPSTRQPDPKPIGLAIADSLHEPGLTRTGSRTILFGPQLRIQVPESPPFSSPGDFGIKTPTRNSSPLGSNPVPGSGQYPARLLTGHLSELSEDYTCVTSHGPNPRTIHIFDNDFIVESQSDAVSFRSPEPGRETGSGYCSPDHFLSTCCTCKKNLGPREDIFMYRGERAFCSSECRSQEMMLEDKNMK